MTGFASNVRQQPKYYFVGLNCLGEKFGGLNVMFSSWIMVVNLCIGILFVFSL